MIRVPRPNLPCEAATSAGPMIRSTLLTCLFLALTSCATGIGEPDEEVPAAEPGGARAVSVPANTEPVPTPIGDRAAPANPHLRVVWTRDVGDGTDFFSLGDRLLLMAHDSRDGRGERVVLNETASYAKPLIAPDGESIVFSIRRQNAVYAIDWDGTGLRRIADGFGLDVWADPADGRQWVYVGVDEAPTDPPSYPAVRRHWLADPTVSEIVWDAQPVSGDSFQVSADGGNASALLPWPTAGVADLNTGTWRKLGEGCWTAFSPGEEPLFWYFDGAHRNVTIVNIETEERWQVSVSDGPAFGGFEVYHPRWTNHPRALVVTGPYTVGDRANKIRGGGRQVEVHVGFFDETFTTISSWSRVTHNDHPDFYPDAWIAPGTLPERPERVAGAAVDTVSDRDESGVVAEVRPRYDVTLPTPTSIAPYREGLLALEYDVVNVVDGQLDVPVIAVAHWVIHDGRTIVGAERPAGRALRLELFPYEARRELEGKRLVMETTDLTLPLFYDVASSNPVP